MRNLRVLAALVACCLCCLLLTSMANSHYEKAIYHQGKAEQAYKYNLVSMMEAHLDSMENEIGEMEMDNDDCFKNKDRLLRGYYKLWGDYCYLTDDLESALYWYNLAQPMFARHDSTGYYAIIHEEKAQLYYKMKEWEMAKNHADTLKSLYNDSIDYKNSDKAIYWSSVSDLCQAREAVDDYLLGFTNKAETEFNSSITHINTILKEYLSPEDGDLYYDVMRTRAKILMLKSEQDGIYNDQAHKDFQDYFNRKKAQISGTLLGMTEAQREEFWMQEQRFVTDCYRLEEHAPELLYDVTLFAKGILLHLGKNGTDNHEKLQFTTYKDVQRALPNRACAIEFIQYEKDREQHMSALVLKNSGKPEFVHIGKVDDILETPIPIGEFYTKSIREIINVANESNHDYRYYNYLYEDTTWRSLVWTPQLMSIIKDYERVYFAPEGFLRAVAIEYALPQEYENLDLYRLSSTQVIASSKAKANKTALYQGNALIIGIDYCGDIECQVPDILQGPGDNDQQAYRFLREENFYFPILATSKMESDSIVEIRNNLADLCLLDTEASELAVRQLCNKFSIIHFSTHGYSFSYDGEDLYNEIKPASVDYSLSRSGIALANSNCNTHNSYFNPKYYDGILSAREISKCDLSGAELVVTSACKTAVGAITSDGNYSVERGLKAAGAKAIIVSLWSVSSYSAVPFFSCFYHELSQGSSMHKALMAARNYVKNYSVLEHEGAYNGFFDMLLEEYPFNYPCDYNPFILIDALE